MLTAHEIISLIEAASKHGVTRLRAGEVDVTFSGYVPPAQGHEALHKLLEESATDEWLAQNIPPPPLPAEEVE